MTLSDKMIRNKWAYEKKVIRVEDVKEFLKELKEELDKEINWWVTDASNKEIEDADLPDRLKDIKLKIDKLAGKELVK